MFGNKSKYYLTVLFYTGIFTANAQSNSVKEEFYKQRLNTITTAVPFLIIAPDSRAGAMGDAGVSTSPDANSIHWNPAKLGFIEKEMGFTASYTPWLRKLVPDINLSYLSGYKRVDNMSVLSASLLYFSLGDIQFTDEYGNNTTQFRPNEFAFDVSFARKLSKYFSGGISVRYINSNLTGGVLVSGQESRAGQAVAADVSTYFQNDQIKIGNKKSEVAAGLNISNIGNKMSYTTSSKRDFIPINMRLGPRITVDLDNYNTISITTDINKLLVPTRPIYKTDSAGNPELNSDGSQIIIAGQNPDRAVASGMFGSFNDAPGIPARDDQDNILYNSDGTTAQIETGSVFKEELREIMYSFGLEYWYDKQFAVRTGYFYEHALKGNRKYITIGAGLKYNVFALDFAYLIPAYFSNQTRTQRSPLENTLRFTLIFDFDAFKSQKEELPEVK